jgi:hypothetical protein
MNLNLNRNNLYSQLYRVYKDGTSPFKMEHFELNYGDEYYTECNNSLVFKIGVNKYEVGYYHITEDGHDWAQAESYNGDIFKKNDLNVSWSDIVEDLNNYKQIERDLILNKLLND